MSDPCRGNAISHHIHVRPSRRICLYLCPQLLPKVTRLPLLSHNMPLLCLICIFAIRIAPALSLVQSRPRFVCNCSVKTPNVAISAFKSIGLAAFDPLVLFDAFDESPAAGSEFGAGEALVLSIAEAASIQMERVAKVVSKSSDKANCRLCI